MLSSSESFWGLRTSNFSILIPHTIQLTDAVFRYIHWLHMALNNYRTSLYSQQYLHVSSVRIIHYFKIKFCKLPEKRTLASSRNCEGVCNPMLCLQSRFTQSINMLPGQLCDLEQSCCRQQSIMPVWPRPLFLLYQILLEFCCEN